jgi:dienelactone hydrolase
MRSTTGTRLAGRAIATTGIATCFRNCASRTSNKNQADESILYLFPLSDRSGILRQLKMSDCPAIDQFMRSMKLALILNLLALPLLAGETFTPYRNAAEVPRNVVDLWKDYDARKEALDVKVVKEWKGEGVVTRYVTFKVGTFKGTDARIAAYYSFPAKGRKHAAFVWSHGGGQRATRSRGMYFAKQGFATVDINWLGRPMEQGIKINTDWGKVDPTQGPRFYAKALRKGWKRNLQPDEHSIDPVISPRNANWFLLTVAARRAITFLEQQPEVDAGKIGFTGFSMGGMITSLVAIDLRLKAVAPFVGGSGFKYIDFPGGISGSSIRAHFRDDLELYKSTIDASAYWPLVPCPVVFISSSNDFHSTFERIYRSMALLKHRDWRVTTNIHHNHGPGPEQWAVLNLWFNQYLKGQGQDIPVTPPSTLHVSGKIARFMVTPADQDRLVGTEIYFSHDPNSRTRFWNRAAPTPSDKSWRVDLTVHDDLPLYVFAICRYRLAQEMTLDHGETATFALNSLEQMIVPQTVNLKALTKLKKPGTVFEDFKNGIQDWSSRDGRAIRTYKFQNPELDRSNDQQLALTIDPKGKKLFLRLTTSSTFLSRENNIGNFSLTKPIEGDGARKILIDRTDFKGDQGKTLEWSKIATFDVTLVDQDTKAKLELGTPAGHRVLQRIELIDAK